MKTRQSKTQKTAASRTAARVGSSAMVRCFSELLKYAECNTCLHEETHRGGAIWTICDQCGAKWADDEGGVPHDAHEYPKPIRDAQDMLALLT